MTQKTQVDYLKMAAIWNDKGETTAAVNMLIAYLEQQPATAQMTVTQEPVNETRWERGTTLTDAAPPCEHSVLRTEENWHIPLALGQTGRCRMCESHFVIGWVPVKGA